MGALCGFLGQLLCDFRACPVPPHHIHLLTRGSSLSDPSPQSDSECCCLSSVSVDREQACLDVLGALASLRGLSGQFLT